jgi:hypothetical protein
MVIVKPSGTHFLAASSIPVRLGSFLGIGSVLAIIALYLGNALGGSITERLPQGISDRLLGTAWGADTLYDTLIPVVRKFVLISVAVGIGFAIYRKLRKVLRAVGATDENTTVDSPQDTL